MKLVRRIINRLSGRTKQWERTLEGVCYKFDTDISDCAPADALPAVRLIAKLTASGLSQFVGPNSSSRIFDAPAHSLTVYELEEAFHHTAMLVAGAFVASQKAKGLRPSKFFKIAQRCFGRSSLGAGLYAAFAQPSNTKEMQRQLEDWFIRLSAVFKVEHTNVLKVAIAQMVGLAFVKSILDSGRDAPIELPASCLVDSTEDDEDDEQSIAARDDAKSELPTTADPSVDDDGSTGRNARCPCGSGIRFKHCCGKPTDIASAD